MSDVRAYVQFYLVPSLIMNGWAQEQINKGINDLGNKSTNSSVSINQYEKLDANILHGFHDSPYPFTVFPIPHSSIFLSLFLSC